MGEWCASTSVAASAASLPRQPMRSQGNGAKQSARSTRRNGASATRQKHSLCPGTRLWTPISTRYSRRLAITSTNAENGGSDVVVVPISSEAIDEATTAVEAPAVATLPAGWRPLGQLTE